MILPFNPNEPGRRIRALSDAVSEIESLRRRSRMLPWEQRRRIDAQIELLLRQIEGSPAKPDSPPGPDM